MFRQPHMVAWHSLGQRTFASWIRFQCSPCGVSVFRNCGGGIYCSMTKCNETQLWTPKQPSWNVILSVSEGILGDNKRQATRGHPTFSASAAARVSSRLQETL